MRARLSLAWRLLCALLLLGAACARSSPRQAAVRGAQTNNSTNANWMQWLMPYIGNLSLTDVTLPGSHDSGTYDLSLFVSPELEPWEADIIDFLEEYFPDLQIYAIIRDWAKTQNYSLYDQLMMGIRHFDIRVCWDSATQVFRAFHFVMSNRDLQMDLLDILKFMQQYKEEVIVVMFSHFSGMDDALHTSFIQMLENTLQGYFMPRAVGFGPAISQLVASNQRILAYYDDADAIGPYPFLWSTDSLVSDWANVDQFGVLWDQQTKDVRASPASGDPSKWYYPQWILTEDVEDIVNGVLMPDKYPYTVHQLARTANVHLDEFLRNVSQFRLNVIYVDWFQETDAVEQAKILNRRACNDNPKYRIATDPNGCYALFLRGRCNDPDSFMQQNCRLMCDLCPPVHGAPGDACSSNADCLSGHCVGGMCLVDAPEGPGEPCGRDFQCWSAQCNNFACA